MVAVRLATLGRVGTSSSAIGYIFTSASQIAITRHASAAGQSLAGRREHHPSDHIAIAQQAKGFIYSGFRHVLVGSAAKDPVFASANTRSRSPGDPTKLPRIVSARSAICGSGTVS